MYIDSTDIAINNALAAKYSINNLFLLGNIIVTI